MRGVIRDIRACGIPFLAYHPWRQHAKRAAEGWPDWALLSRKGFMIRELKREGEKPKPEQREWLEMFRAVGVDADVWYPSDWYSGRIARELCDLAGLGGAR